MDQPRPRDPLGLVGLFSGIGAAVTVPLILIPLLGCLCFPFGPLGSLAGLGFGVASLVRTGEGGAYSGRTTAIASVLVSFVYWLLLAGIYLWVGDDFRRGFEDTYRP